MNLPETKTSVRPAVFLNLNTTEKPSTSRGTPTLTQGVLAAVRAIDEETLRRVAKCDAGSAYQPKTLLAILTVCYLRQIYGSREIELLIGRDVEFRKLCGEEFPGAGVFRRFRRHNREALTSCLTTVLKLIVTSAHPSADQTVPTEVELCAEAERRVSTAALIDSVEWDDD